MDKETILKDNDAFCILPWITMHIWPNGNTMPCCLADSDNVFGNAKENTISELINTDKFKELRKGMLNGEKLPACRRCYELETSTNIWTLRKNSNQWFADKHFDLVEKTNEDGSVDDFRMAYFDLRFSNICNMKCRSCGPELSSQHAKEFKELYGEHELARMLKNDGKIVVNVAHQPGFWEDLQKYLPDVEEAYWAGGEPLITDEHYRILDLWVEQGKRDVRLRYTTNFSNFNYKRKSVLDYWKDFDDIQVSASLDANGLRAEYMRSGTDWYQIERNREQMIEQVPHVHFELTPTISLYNVWNFPDFHMDWVDRGLVSIENCRLNMLTFPEEMRINHAPEEYKIELRSKYLDYKSWAFDKIKDRVDAEPNLMYDVIGKIDTVIRFLNTGNPNPPMLKKFFKQGHKLDQFRREDFWQVFPEMKWLRDYV
jgi:hypothetical protein